MSLSGAVDVPLVAIADEESDHAANDGRNGNSLPRMIMDVLVGYMRHVFGFFGDAVLHFAEAIRHVGFRIGFVCGFHIFAPLTLLIRPQRIARAVGMTSALSPIVPGEK